MSQVIGTARLEDGDVRVDVLSLGARLQDWRVPVNGQPRSVVLGHADPRAYRRDPVFLGAIVGRVANRIGGAAYVQGGRRVILKANDGLHQLHGGPDGLWAQDWTLDSDGPRALRLTHLSPAGAGGFPGRVAFCLDLHLAGARLTFDLQALPDEETPLSLAQHNYYSLGPGTRLRLAADRRLQRDPEGIMTGAILADPAPLAGLTLPDTATGPGLLDDFYLFQPQDPALPVAEALGADGLRLRLWSDQPGAQVYTGQGLAAAGLPPCAGFCIEPSGLPNALNCPGFPPILHSPDRPYRQILTVEIAQAR